MKLLGILRLVATAMTIAWVCGSFAGLAVAADWQQWRGPNRDNISVEKGFLKEWREGGPPLLWRVDGIGEGIAAVSIAGGQVYTLGYLEEGEFVMALDQQTGKRLWMT